VCLVAIQTSNKLILCLTACLVACHLLRNGEKQDEDEEEEEEEEGEEGEGGHCVRLEALLMLCRYGSAFLKGLCHEMNNI
jgi:hypothetical protein